MHSSAVQAALLFFVFCLREMRKVLAGAVRAADLIIRGVRLGQVAIAFKPPEGLLAI